MIDQIAKHYFNYEEITKVLQQLEKEYPDLLQVESIGKTAEGREIWLATVTQKQGKSHAEKPGYWVDGNTHASELAGCQACLYLIQHCLQNYATSQDIKRLLDEQVFYVVPRISADGSELCLTTPHLVRSSPVVCPERDPLPGLYPKDIDGNGWIGVMRRKDPFGSWKVSQKDPRIMLLRGPDEEDANETYYSLYHEGEILNFDGQEIVARRRANLDLNRNYPKDWQPQSRGFSAGEAPLSQPESRAVVDAIVKRPNIVGLQSFHTFSGIILRPFANKSDDDMAYGDLQVYQALGERGQECTGYPHTSVFHGFRYHPKTFISGGFFDWAYSQRGIFAFTNEIWHLFKQAGVEIKDHAKFFGSPIDENDEAKVLKWCDDNLEKGSYFQEWQAFDHSQLGPVEIGGWKTLYTFSNPPIAYLETELKNNVEFVLRCARANPCVVVKEAQSVWVDEKAKVRKLSLTLVNKGYLPTYGSECGLQSGIVKTPRVRVQLGDAVQCVQGQLDFEIQNLSGRVNKTLFQNLYFHSLAQSSEPNAQETRLEWVVQGEGSVEVSVQFERAGTVRYVFE